MPFPTKPVSFGSKAECGLVALMELASSYATGLILRVTEIASRQSIPNRYLEQIFAMLRCGHPFSSVRGPLGLSANPVTPCLRNARLSSQFSTPWQWISLNNAKTSSPARPSSSC